MKIIFPTPTVPQSTLTSSVAPRHTTNTLPHHLPALHCPRHNVVCSQQPSNYKQTKLQPKQFGLSERVATRQPHTQHPFFLGGGEEDSCFCERGDTLGCCPSLSNGLVPEGRLREVTVEPVFNDTTSSENVLDVVFDPPLSL